MELFDKIELRRFVGREFLLWLWFESEVLEATLATKPHGSFGMWLEGRLVLSEGREVTTIRGSSPGNHREAKESLRRGKLPELASFHLSWADKEATFVLKGERMAIGGLSLPTQLGKAEDEAPALAPPPRRPKRGRAGPADTDEGHEAFYERMALTREIETILEALYSDFLGLRLGRAWDELVRPALAAWVGGEDVDAADYARRKKLALRGK